MLRLIITLLVSVSVGRWLYSEIELVAPPLLPAVNYVLSATELPTHDKWSKDSFEEVLLFVHGAAQRCMAALAKEQPEVQPALLKKERGSPKLRKINQQLALMQQRLAQT